MDYKFSVITLVLNGARTIEKAILSVINQNYANFEYIVIDGGSTDGTLRIIEKYTKKINYWISEPDKGIYDAMNKGIIASTGDIVFFLHADDYFYDIDILLKTNHFFHNQPKVQLAYGQVAWVFSNPDYMFMSAGNLSLQGLRNGNVIFQPATFFRKQAFELGGLFNEKYKISGDFDFFCRFILLKLHFARMPYCVSYFTDGGLSSNHAKTFAEAAEIIRKYFGFYFYIKYVIKSWVFLFTKKMMKMTGLFFIYKRFMYYYFSAKTQQLN